MLVIPAEFRGFDYTQMARALRGDLPRLEHVFVARGQAPSDMKPFALLTTEAWEDRQGRRPLTGTDPNHVHEVVFTSGTTGEPKGVMHAYNTVLSIIYPVIDRLAFSERDVILMGSTLGHQTGYLYGFCLNLLLGARAVWLDIWSRAGRGPARRGRACDLQHGGHAVSEGPDIRRAGPRPFLAACLHLRWRSHSPPPGPRCAGADSAARSLPVGA